MWIAPKKKQIDTINKNIKKKKKKKWIIKIKKIPILIVSYGVIPCEKSEKKITDFFFNFWLEKSKVLVILGIKIALVTCFGDFDLFIEFGRKSQILVIC